MTGVMIAQMNQCNGGRKKAHTLDRALGAREGDSRFGAAIRENSSRGSEKRVENLGNGEPHSGHK